MSYDSDNPVEQLAAVRQAIGRVLLAQRTNVGSKNATFAELSQLRALEKDLILQININNGGYGSTGIRINRPR